MGNNGNTWTAATPRKRVPSKSTWNSPQKTDSQMGRQPHAPMKTGAPNGAQPAPPLPPPQGVVTRSGTPVIADGQNAVVLCLLSLNGTFERKTISVPYYPNTLRIGRQTNQKTVPTPTNGYFDSKVLSRQHAEIWADRETAKVYIRDVKSSNGTFVNGNRLSQENRESEPHELNIGDQLELGIDIVHDDQKTVVHHKVAAKVEHVGFLPNSLPEMFAGDVDLSSGANGMQGQARNRTGSNVSMASNGRAVPLGAINAGMQHNGMGPSRPNWMNQVTTDQIVKKLHQEMRSCRLQGQDLLRTTQFIGALAHKDDLRGLDMADGHEPHKPHVNGNGLFGSFQGNKTLFSEPPAPPPQQPLPEKPDVARHGETNSIKRGLSDRPRGQKESHTQIAQLAEDLKNARRELDNQNARMRDLEGMLNKERLAREAAEELARRLEAASKAAESRKPVEELDDAFNPPTEETQSTVSPAQSDAAASLQARLDAMMSDMLGLKEQLDEYKQRAQKAEGERDTTRKSLSDMVVQLKEEQAARKAAESEVTSLQTRRFSNSNGTVGSSDTVSDSSTKLDTKEGGGTKYSVANHPSLSRSSTVTPAKTASHITRRAAMAETLPYASVIGVVVLGMGLMAYLNGWQPEPRVQR